LKSSTLIQPITLAYKISGNKKDWFLCGHLPQY